MFSLTAVTAVAAAVAALVVALWIGNCRRRRRDDVGAYEAFFEDAGLPPSSSHDRCTKPSTTDMRDDELQHIADATSGGSGYSSRVKGALYELSRRQGRQ